MNLNVGLSVNSSGVRLRLLGRNRGVAGDHLGHHTTQGLHTQRERGDIQQQNVLHFASEHTALNGSTNRNHFIGIDGLVGVLAGDTLDQFEHGRDAGGTTHHHDFVQLAGGQLGVLERLLHRHGAAVDQLGGQFLELGAGEGEIQVLGTSGVAVMNGRLISLWVALDSSTLAFSAASVRRCRACLS